MKRTLLKTLTYAAMHFVVAIAVAFALTGDWRLALAVGIVEPIVQTLAFAVHERLWAAKPGATPEPPCSHTALASALLDQDLKDRPSSLSAERTGA